MSFCQFTRKMEIDLHAERLVAVFLILKKTVWLAQALPEELCYRSALVSLLSPVFH